MHFPKFWASVSQAMRDPAGNDFTLMKWGWSDAGAAEAEARARDALKAVAARVKAGDAPPSHYLYGDRPMREEVIKEIHGGDGGLAAAVTCNAYGCLVLNTARVMFIDIDLADAPAPGGGLLGRLFGKPKPAAATPEAVALEQLQAAVNGFAGAGLRVYGTKAGLRVLVTHALFDPEGEEARRWMEAVGADPLYVRLCKAQKSFRARLTPKPWRCDCDVPRVRYPWKDAAAQQRFRDWEKGYVAAAMKYSVCRFIATLGAAPVLPEIQPVVALHDEMTRVGSTLPLA